MAVPHETASEYTAGRATTVAYGRPALLGAALGHLRRPTRSSLEVALKAATATALAMWLANRLGLENPYWAGISAIVATGGTLGASLRAAISRVSATVVGLAFGLGAVTLPVSGVLVGAATGFLRAPRDAGSVA